MTPKMDYIELLRQKLGEVTTMSASDAKNQFGQALDAALRDGAVVITKHDTPKAVLISVHELERITEHRKLDAWSREYDEMFERMQRPQQKAAAHAAFDASPEQLGEAAVKPSRARPSTRAPVKAHVSTRAPVRRAKK